MDKLLEERSHTNREIDADTKNNEIEVQQDDNIINKLNNQSVNNISNGEQVCINDLSTHQSFVTFDFTLEIETHI
jgi:hypothetical protein